MFDEQARAFLVQPLIARFTTIRPDGYPHTVPVWFLLDGNDLLVFSLRETLKVKNVLRNAKGGLAIGGDPASSPGYAIDGDIIVEDDPDHLVAERITRHYESPEEANKDLSAWQDEEFVALRLIPRRVVKVA